VGEQRTGIRRRGADSHPQRTDGLRFAPKCKVGPDTTCQHAFVLLHARFELARTSGRADGHTRCKVTWSRRTMCWSGFGNATWSYRLQQIAPSRRLWSTICAGRWARGNFGLAISGGSAMPHAMSELAHKLRRATQRACVKDQGGFQGRLWRRAAEKDNSSWPRYAAPRYRLRLLQRPIYRSCRRKLAKEKRHGARVSLCRNRSSKPCPGLRTR